MWEWRPFSFILCVGSPLGNLVLAAETSLHMRGRGNFSNPWLRDIIAHSRCLLYCTRDIGMMDANTLMRAATVNWVICRGFRSTRTRSWHPVTMGMQRITVSWTDQSSWYQNVVYPDRLWQAKTHFVADYTWAVSGQILNSGPIVRDRSPLLSNWPCFASRLSDEFGKYRSICSDRLWQAKTSFVCDLA